MSRDIATQVPFEVTEFAENPEPRCPCILILDCSRSMREDDRIEELNRGVREFRNDLLSDDLATKRVELAVVTMGGKVRVQAQFETVDYFNPVDLTADDDTPMGEAILTAIDLVESRKEVYRKSGISYFRPWIILITDGEPTDSWHEAAERITAGERAKQFMFFPIGVAGANLNILTAMSVRQPVRLKGLEFRSMFRWLSNSLRSTSHSKVGEVIALENPTGPKGWASTE